MELRRLAERILHGDALSDKLAWLSPGERLSDEDPGPRLSAPPDAPGRPDGLRLRGDVMARPFPSLTALADPAAAGAALHAFANHELLALELMALMLLRFPEADPALRRELAATMRDEQRHMQLYIDRMAELGVAFGEGPTSPFFWDCLAGVDTMGGFVAGMSLTLEQANLDFAEGYARAFRAVGDEDTARILDRVHAEEIVHVARGLRWLPRRSPSLWDDWVALLPAPLTPRRARGPEPSREARRKAGLPDDFIDRVSTHGHSRGRSPDVYLWNPGCEDEIAAGLAHQPSRAMRTLAEDLDTIWLAVAGEDDVVVVTRAPRPAFLEEVRRAGFALPRFVVASYPVRLADQRPRSLQPWGWSPVVADRLAALGGAWSPALAALHDKAEAGDLLHGALDALSSAAGEGRLLPRSALPRRVSSVAEAEEAIVAVRAAGHPHVVFKRRFGASGRGQLRLLDEPVVTAPQRGWLARHAAEGLRVEPWLDRREDLSFHFDATPTGVRLRGVVRFEADRRGAFVGAWVGPPTRGMSPDAQRCLSGDGQDARWLDRVGRALAQALGPAVDAAGHRGPLGVDAFLYVADDGLRLHPLVEINPRWTMGRLALGLRKRGRTGTLRLLGVAAAGDAIAAGAVALTDPERARHHVAVLVESAP